MNAKERFSGDPHSEGTDCYWFHAMEARTKNTWIFFHYTPETKQLEGVKSGFGRNHHHVAKLRVMRIADSADFADSEKRRCFVSPQNPQSALSAATHHGEGAGAAYLQQVALKTIRAFA